MKDFSSSETIFTKVKKIYIFFSSFIVVYLFVFISINLIVNVIKYGK